MSAVHRSWQVFLLGGASGVGKTSLSYRLARHFDIAITEVDDFQVMLECLTTPEQQPALHFWRTHPAPDRLQPEEIVANGIAIGNLMLPGLVAIILNHIETRTPVVLEGDFILPAVMAHPTLVSHVQSGLVCAAIVHEPEESQILSNFLQREPETGPQHLRATVSGLYGRWLKQEAHQHNIPVLLARPWDSAFERLIAISTFPPRAATPR